MKATIDSMPYAGVLLAHPKVAEFVESVWPSTMGEALLGRITSEEMMTVFDKHFQ